MCYFETHAGRLGHMIFAHPNVHSYTNDYYQYFVGKATPVVLVLAK